MCDGIKKVIVKQTPIAKPQFKFASVVLQKLTFLDATFFGSRGILNGSQ